jgi:hypothetical protein
MAWFDARLGLTRRIAAASDPRAPDTWNVDQPITGR